MWIRGEKLEDASSFKALVRKWWSSFKAIGRKWSSSFKAVGRRWSSSFTAVGRKWSSSFTRGRRKWLCSFKAAGRKWSSSFTAAGRSDQVSLKQQGEIDQSSVPLWPGRGNFCHSSPPPFCLPCPAYLSLSSCVLHFSVLCVCVISGLPRVDIHRVRHRVWPPGAPPLTGHWQLHHQGNAARGFRSLLKNRLVSDLPSPVLSFIFDVGKGSFVHLLYQDRAGFVVVLETVLIDFCCDVDFIDRILTSLWLCCRLYW